MRAAWSADTIRAALASLVQRLRFRLFPHSRKVVTIDLELAAMRAALEETRARVQELEARPRPGMAQMRGQLTLTLNTRALALKMAGQGKTSEEIATQLGIPRGEILLLLKVQRLSGGRASTR